MSSNKNTLLLWLHFTKGVAIAIAALVLKSIVSLFVWFTYAADGPLGEMENYAIYIVIFISSLFVYNSVIGILFTYDFSSAKRFLEDFKNPTQRKIPFIFSDKYFFIESLSTLLTLSLSALLGACPEITGMFYFKEGKSPYASGFFPFIFTLLIVSVIILFARYETVRYWKALYAKENLKELQSKPRLIIRIAAIVILYPIVFPYMPLLLYVFLTVAGIFNSLSKILTVPGLVLIILFIFAAIFGIFVLLAIRKRKRFFREVKGIVKDHGFTMSEIKNPYVSLLSKSKQCSFTVTYNKTDFDCVVLGHIFYSIPVCFTADGEGFFRYRLGTKRHNITLEHRFEYSANENATKILIISPSPKHALIIDRDKEKRLFNAEKLWSFVIYEDEAFAGTLDRMCLGRYDDKKV